MVRAGEGIELDRKEKAMTDASSNEGMYTGAIPCIH